ncbi:flagellar basal body rod protein FlgB [Hahella aquimaris]|uniref:flagellar basal body rod protein FlgB n=1 Tax=Hahella sp. HNIBRBA332 TaxID=3015983 RepID=UPI00273BAD90|nr:flagellar basal body rod protein FlgB [Hahella sp. HNIBRBA332]WLQ17310.1 flagellar basal body rod protein FlgB [Hahella sp. HNIBRBA332]
MAISFDKALGIHEQALNVRARRAEVLANNIANADTPGFRARDIDFKAVLRQAKSIEDSLEVVTTHDAHMAIKTPAEGALLYRQPLQPSIDGNTVDTQTEIVQYSKNALDFQASFEFLNSRLKGIVSAIKGE